MFRNYTKKKNTHSESENKGEKEESNSIKNNGQEYKEKHYTKPKCRLIVLQLVILSSHWLSIRRRKYLDKSQKLRCNSLPCINWQIANIKSHLITLPIMYNHVQQIKKSCVSSLC